MLGHKVWVCSNLGLPWWLSSKESTCNAGGSIPWVGKDPLEEDMATESEATEHSAHTACSNLIVV